MNAAGLLCAAFVAPSPAPIQQQPSFAAAVEAVVVDVFVTRDRRPVRGLSASDFEVLDDGVRQTVTLARLEEVPIVAVLVFDTSGSVAGAKLEDLRAAGRALVEGLRPQDQAAFVSFSQELRVVAPQGSNRSAVSQALRRLVAGGGTAVWDALYAGLQLPAAHRRPMVVLFTDGQDNMSWLSADHVLKVAEQSEALVHVVAIVPPPASVFTVRGWEAPWDTRSVEPRSLRSLRRIAESTGGRLWAAGASADLERTFLGILAEMQSRYLLSFDPGPGARPGWHRLQVRLKRHKATVRSRSGYLVSAAHAWR